MTSGVRPALNREFLREVLFRLIAIDSRNPTLTPDAPGEEDLANFIMSELARIGLEPSRQETAQPNRPNVVATMPGRRSGTPSLMLLAHMDTVGVDGMSAPFLPWEQHGQVYGRGAQDMKGSIAAMLAVADALVQAGHGPEGDLTLAFVSDEEADSIGAQRLVEDPIAEQTLVLEPTGMEIAVAHRGFAWYTVTAEGRAAHGSRWQEGIDAISCMGVFLAALHEHAAELVTRPSSTAAGPPSIHASTIAGGTAISIYPATCTVRVERRTAPGEALGDVTGEIRALIEATNRHLGAERLSLSLDLVREPFESRADGTLLDRLCTAASGAMGVEPEVVGAPYWTDAAILAAAGSDCVIFGPLGYGLHTTEEWVDLASVHQTAEVLIDLVCAE